MPKYRLLTPGPTQVPDDALLALARPIKHHRTAEFRELLAEVLLGLKHVFQTDHDVLVLTSSGTGAMEAAVANLVPRGGKAIVLESGKFSERWRLICEAFGIGVIRHEVPWGQAFSAEDVARLLRENPDATAVYSTLSESSTGVGHDIEAIGQVVRATPALLVVDAISGAGAMPCRTDAWGIDVLVAGSQKALMGPPGLAMLAVSPKAWRQIESIDRQAFYFDLMAYRKALAEPDTPYTPAIPLVVALVASLRQIRRQGIETIWARTNLLARATRAGVQALGMKLVAARPADSLTAAFFPEGVDGKAFLKRLEARFGVKLAGGQGHLKGRILRIGHFGLIDELDVLSALAAMELVLVELGQSVKLGSGVAAASEVLAEAAMPGEP
jgi:serine---pyruvate transaminase